MGNATTTPAYPAGPSPSTTPTIKLLIDKRGQRVLFAEAGKDVVDFLFGLLAMPVGAVVKLLAKEADSLGSVANIYASAGKMEAAYMQSHGARDALLNPNPVHPSIAAAVRGFPFLVRQQLQPPPPRSLPLPSPLDPSLPPPQMDVPLYAQRSSMPYPRMNPIPSPKELPSLGGAGGAHGGAYGASQGSRGFVQDVVTYTIMDDLTITPMSNISGIALLNKLGVEEVVVLEEKTVKIGYQEGLEILKASLQSKTVLSDVFLAKKKRARTSTSSDKNKSSDKNGAGQEEE